MPVQLPKRPVLRNAVQKVQSTLPLPKPPLAPGAALQEAKQRALALIGKVRGNHQATGNPLFQQYVDVLMSGSAEGEKLKSQLISEARAQFERHKGQCVSIYRVLQPLQSLQAQLRFRREVLHPAKTRTMSSRDCVLKTSGFLNTPPKTPIYDWLESVFGPLTFGIGAGVEGGAGAGMEGAMGIAFRRGSRVLVSQATSVAFGAYAEATASVFGSVAGGAPKEGNSLTMDVSFSAASGVSGEVVVSLAPTFHKPSDPAKRKKEWKLDKVFGGDAYRGILVDYSFAGLSASLGVGAGVQAAIGFTVTTSMFLSGPVDQKPSTIVGQLFPERFGDEV